MEERTTDEATPPPVMEPEVRKRCDSHVMEAAHPPKTKEPEKANVGKKYAAE